MDFVGRIGFAVVAVEGVAVAVAGVEVVAVVAVRGPLVVLHRRRLVVQGQHDCCGLAEHPEVRPTGSARWRRRLALPSLPHLPVPAWLRHPLQEYGEDWMFRLAKW